jgi:uncharacterized protein YicC (UPF0701 family)
MPLELAAELELDPPAVDVEEAAGVVCDELAVAGARADVEEELDGLPPHAATPRAVATTAAANSFRLP